MRLSGAGILGFVPSASRQLCPVLEGNAGNTDIPVVFPGIFASSVVEPEVHLNAETPPSLGFARVKFCRSTFGSLYIYMLPINRSITADDPFAPPPLSFAR